MMTVVRQRRLYSKCGRPIYFKNSEANGPPGPVQFARWRDVTDMEGLFQAVEPVKTSEWWKCAESEHYKQQNTKQLT